MVDLNNFCKMLEGRLNFITLNYNKEWSRAYPNKAKCSELEGAMKAYKDILDYVKRILEDNEK